MKNPIDDIPIPVKHKGDKPKTFEQLLEAELAREAKDQEPLAEAEPPSETKKTFLKRKSINEGTDKKRGGTSAKKSYRYYVDNFQKESAREKRGDRDQAERRQGLAKKLDFDGRGKQEDAGNGLLFKTNGTNNSNSSATKVHRMKESSLSSAKKRSYTAIKSQKQFEALGVKASKQPLELCWGAINEQEEIDTR